MARRHPLAAAVETLVQAGVPAWRLRRRTGLVDVIHLWVMRHDAWSDPHLVPIDGAPSYALAVVVTALRGEGAWAGPDPAPHEAAVATLAPLQRGWSLEGYSLPLGGPRVRRGLKPRERRDLDRIVAELGPGPGVVYRCRLGVDVAPAARWHHGESVDAAIRSALQTHGEPLRSLAS